jgi:hypothetical protein
MLIQLIVMVDFGEGMNSLEFLEENVPARLLALQRSSHYLKDVIKSVKLETQICHT